MKFITTIFLLSYFYIGIHANSITEIPNTIFVSDDDFKFETIALNYLGLQEDDCAIHLIAKKKLPYADKTVIVIPEYISESRDEYYGFDVNLHILLIDNTNQEVTAYYPNEFIAVSDAIKLESLSIDTGLFILNEEHRAFGIVVGHSNSRRYGYYNSSTLSLFIQKNKTLYMVLEDLTTDYSVAEYYDCEAEFQTSKSVLIMSDKRTNNFKNIIIKESSTHTFYEKDQNIGKGEERGELEDHPCVESVKNFTNKYILKYVNGKYRKSE